MAPGADKELQNRSKEEEQTEGDKDFESETVFHFASCPRVKSPIVQVIRKQQRNLHCPGAQLTMDGVNTQLCGLAWRTFLGITLVGMLALINFNIQELVQCLMKIPMSPLTN